MSAELGGSQISSLLEALPGIASVLRSPVADALVKAIRAAAGVGEFTFDDAEELVRYAVRRGPIGPEKGDRVLADVEVLKSNAKPARALRAKAHLALRAAAEHTARQALAREAELANQPPQPATVAVLPLVVAGDSTVQPLSRGLAELITTDLAYIRTLRLLERLQIGMLLDELKLGQSERVDPATAARVGRLLRAERLVQGTATIPSRGPVQLSATVVTGSGVVRSEEHTSELQSPDHLVCRLLLEKKKRSCTCIDTLRKPGPETLSRPVPARWCCLIKSGHS